MILPALIDHRSEDSAWLIIRVPKSTYQLMLWSVKTNSRLLTQQAILILLIRVTIKLSPSQMESFQDKMVRWNQFKEQLQSIK